MQAPPSNSNSSGLRNEHEFLDLLESTFRQHGWRANKELPAGDRKIDLVTERGKDRYVVELKVASEGRPDRLLPLFSQAILEAQANARAFRAPAKPLAVVGAPVISRSAAKGLASFLSRVAPDTAMGILDRQGFRYFVGPGLEELDAAPPRTGRLQKLPHPESGSLFSDLNQWMLKVLLAPLIPEDMLQAPRGEYRNASELAAAAEVSVMSAFRLVRQLRKAGFLDPDGELLHLVRRKELLHRWQAAHLRGTPEVPLRWIIPAQKTRQMQSALQAYSAQSAQKHKSAPRVCLGLFAAAESLGVGFVHGVPPSFYLERLDGNVLRHLGLSPEGAGQKPDVYAQIPSFRESIFRAAVIVNGVPVSDILQVWLDVSSYPARGEEQAQEIRRQVLAPILEEKR